MIQEAINFNLEKQKDIHKVCLPLENFYGIRLVQFRRFYFKGGLICLFNHEKWMRTSFDNQYWHSTLFHKKLEQLHNKNSLYYLWPDNPILEDPVYCSLYEHGIWNGFHVLKKLTDCIEIYTFASANKDYKARDIYQLETEIIEKFIAFFKCKLFPLIENSEKDISIPFKLVLPIMNREESELKEKFFQEIPVSSFYVRTDGTYVKISKREKDCLSLLSHGKKVKEIGCSLNLSPRTVESYLEKVKRKMNCLTTSQVLHLYQRNFEDMVA